MSFWATGAGCGADIGFTPVLEKDAKRLATPIGEHERSRNCRPAPGVSRFLRASGTSKVRDVRRGGNQPPRRRRFQEVVSDEPKTRPSSSNPRRYRKSTERVRRAGPPEWQGSPRPVNRK